MRLHIEIFGHRQMQRNLLRGASQAANMRKPMNDIVDDMMRVIGATFTGQGRRYGGSWHHLAKATIRDKARRGLDPRILIARGRLMNSMTKRRSRNQSLIVSGSEIQLDSKLPYARTHQYGDRDRGIPKREFIKFYPQDRARWARMAEDALRKAITGV
jgi:phage gpG-like protein